MLSSAVSKSFENDSQNPIINYCSNLTTIQHPLQKELQEETLKNAELAMMLGAPEVLTIGSHLIHLIQGRKVIDIGTYTGASALAWALATPDDGKVYTLDCDLARFKQHGLPIIQKSPKILAKIMALEAAASDTLDKFIHEGEKETFDFAFIDADKQSYSDYYFKCVELLRPGGIIMVDNALWRGRVVDYDEADKITKAIDKCNRDIFADKRINSFLVNAGDGLHFAFKK